MMRNKPRHLFCFILLSTLPFCLAQCKKKALEGTPHFSRLTLPDNGSVLPDTLESCAVYQERACRKGKQHLCAIYDGINGQWAAHPDPLLEQVFWYDRYYDLYHQMEGQYVTLEFTEPMMPGTPESRWGDPQYFQRYKDYGDSAGWTGTALMAAAARYAMTRTEADYRRMLANLETMMFLYEATDIPGLLMRSHFAMLEEGAPYPVGHPGKALVNFFKLFPDSDGFLYPLKQKYLNRLPAYYTQGVTLQGTARGATPYWKGDASRDMYVRSLPGILMAHDLLGTGQRESAIKAAMMRELPCTLRRMKKLRIRNLQQNKQLLDVLTIYINSGAVSLEASDIDLTKLDTLYGYVMEQPSPLKPQLFDPACPDTLPLAPAEGYDLDASSDLLWIVDILNRAQRKGDIPIAWIQFPSVRGSDALFMTQWALTAHYLTGEQRYLDFLKQLMGEIDYWPIINIMGSLQLPIWCRPHFGPSLLYPTLWNLQSRIRKERYPLYWTSLARAIKEEIREKDLRHARDAYFAILYARMVDEKIDPGVKSWVAEMANLLENNTQYRVSDPFEPRRNYSVDLLTDRPRGFEAVTIQSLSEGDRSLCEEPMTVLGIEVPAAGLEDERPRSVEGLPLHLRIPGDFQWQMDPFMLYRSYGGSEGKRQWPMQGFSVAFWMAMVNELTSKGKGHALAWKETAQNCP